MTIYGKVLDNDTRQPVPGATVTLWKNNIKVAAVAASVDGDFSISPPAGIIIPDQLGISSVGYIEKFYPIAEASGTSHFLLIRDIKELPPVVVTPGGTKSNTWLWWALGIAAAIALRKKF
jgi:hypothetical protein